MEAPAARISRMDEEDAGQLSTRWITGATGRLIRRAHFVQLVLLPTVLIPALGAIVASALGASPALATGVVFLLALPTALGASTIFRGRELALWRLSGWARYAAERTHDSTASPTISALMARLGDAFAAESSRSSEEQLSRLEGEISGLANPDDRAALNSVLAVVRARACGRPSRLVARGVDPRCSRRVHPALGVELGSAGALSRRHRRASPKPAR
jgi:hypothetical protein